MAWPLRRYFRLLWWTLCFLTFLALPLTIWEFQKQHYDVHYQAWFIGGIFVILSMPISIYEIAMHTEYYTQPRLQKHVIRILLMVPIYAVDAWFALRFRKAREYLDPIRECYEAFVIYSFFAYLMAYLQDNLGDLDEYMSNKPQKQHLWGLHWILKPWDMGTRFLWECKKGVLNYVILRPICTALAFITDIFDKYGEGQINFKKSYIYLATVTSSSQLWALYCLIMLYTAMHAELAPIRPLSKFICIKAVVFVTFWQGIAIAILVYAGVIRNESWTTYDRQSVAAGIQDFLICIEMFLAALAHAYAFPPRDYMAGHSKGFFSNVRYIFDLRDVVDDVGMVVEEHVSSATSAVVKVPQRAVKKAAQGIAKNTKKLFGAGSGRSSSRLLDEEDEAAAKCALLGPAAVGSSGAGGGGAGGGGGRRHSSSSLGGDAGSPPEGMELLLAPQPHHMTPPAQQPGSAGAGAGGVASSPGFGASRAAAGAGFGLSSMPPPLPPAAAAASLGSGPVPGSAAGGGGLSGLIHSALYSTRSEPRALSGRLGASEGLRRHSGSEGEYEDVAAGFSGGVEMPLVTHAPPAPASREGLGGGGGGGGAAAGHGRLGVGLERHPSGGGGVTVGGGGAGGGPLSPVAVPAGGSGVGASGVRLKQGDASVRGSRGGTATGVVVRPCKDGGDEVLVLFNDGFRPLGGQPYGVGPLLPLRDAEGQPYTPSSATSRALFEPLSGCVFFREGHALMRLDADNVVTLAAGHKTEQGTADGEGGAARFHSCVPLAVDGRGCLFAVPAAPKALHQISVGTPLGSGSREPLPAVAVKTLPVGITQRLGAIMGIGCMADGASVVAVTQTAVHKLQLDGGGSGCVAETLVPLAGVEGATGWADGTGLAARFTAISGAVMDKAGALYISDDGGLRRMDAWGEVTTLIRRGLAGSTRYQLACLPGGGARVAVCGFNASTLTIVLDKSSPLASIAPPEVQTGRSACQVFDLLRRHGPSVVSLRVGGDTFNLHRSVLCAGSEFFARMLEGGFAEGGAGPTEPVELREADPRAFKPLFDYFYTVEAWGLGTGLQQVELGRSSASGGLGSLAGRSPAPVSRLDVPDALLRPTCELAGRLLLPPELQGWLQGATPGTAIDDLVWADRHGMSELAAQLKERIVRHRALVGAGGGEARAALERLAEYSTALAAELMQLLTQCK
ncbi:hypothetical protein HYH03_016428 [Edaphochlamys debaryana]|uniref:BTB domain-containing protein n=1 Tax=Edaphochlamys debaryana TaxID=47281 RepID=A0A835XRL6_9CHLO|nr:hypothetical protein HYH03_016428 [Edaphochlamys debaryana]|eukprot:KAG2484774.1 hypothetical protein HYH03_016428 [Edaphochlamys debaryana]